MANIFPKPESLSSVEGQLIQTEMNPKGKDGSENEKLSQESWLQN